MEYLEEARRNFIQIHEESSMESSGRFSRGNLEKYSGASSIEFSLTNFGLIPEAIYGRCSKEISGIYFEKINGKFSE